MVFTENTSFANKIDSVAIQKLNPIYFKQKNWCDVIPNKGQIRSKRSSFWVHLRELPKWTAEKFALAGKHLWTTIGLWWLCNSYITDSAWPSVRVLSLFWQWTGTFLLPFGPTNYCKKKFKPHVWAEHTGYAKLDKSGCVHTVRTYYADY